MQFRLRTLLIVLAVGPVVLGWTIPPAMRTVQDWLRPKSTEADFDRTAALLLADTLSRAAIRGNLLNDLGEQPADRRQSLKKEPSLSDEIDRLFPPEETSDETPP